MGKALSAGSLATIANCGTGADHAKNLVVSVTPEQPIPGVNFTTTFDYDLDKEVRGEGARGHW
jgi:hypothetical protein